MWYEVVWDKVMDLLQKEWRACCCKFPGVSAASRECWGNRNTSSGTQSVSRLMNGLQTVFLCDWSTECWGYVLQTGNSSFHLLIRDNNPVFNQRWQCVVSNTVNSQCILCRGLIRVSEQFGNNSRYLMCHITYVSFPTIRIRRRMLRVRPWISFSL